MILKSGALPVLGLLGLAFSMWGPGEEGRMNRTMARMETLSPATQDRLLQYGGSVRSRLLPWFQRAGAEYPPKRVVLVGLKRERRLELYAEGESGGGLRYIRDYPVLGASGGPGPKLREGDKQVPEGFYRVVDLNPNSKYHLSLRLDYPNAFDREKASQEGRRRPGGDIMIHGGSRSIGCLAVGDAAAEELFVLTAETGVGKVEAILSPADFRDYTGVPVLQGQPAWVEPLYGELRAAFSQLPSSGSSIR